MTPAVLPGTLLFFADIWGSSASDVYAVGGSTALHWNGTTWTTVPGIGGSEISGSGPSDVWIADFDGMSHFDGTSWSRIAELEGAWVTSVSVAAANDVWALASRSGVQSVEHFDGTELLQRALGAEVIQEIPHS
jgi:hypothetical protein